MSGAFRSPKLALFNLRWSGKFLRYPHLLTESRSSQITNSVIPWHDMRYNQRDIWNEHSSPYVSIVVQIVRMANVIPGTHLPTISPPNTTGVSPLDSITNGEKSKLKQRHHGFFFLFCTYLSENWRKLKHFYWHDHLRTETVLVRSSTFATIKEMGGTIYLTF